MNRAQTTTVEDLLAAVEEHIVGDEVSLTVERRGVATKLKCRLTERAKAPAGAVGAGGRS